MVRRRALLGLVAVAVLGAGLLGLAAPPAQAKVQSFAKIGRTSTYDVVRGHNRTLVVYRKAHYVRYRGVFWYKVLQRRQDAVILRKLHAPLQSGSAETVRLPGMPVSVGKPASASSFRTAAAADAANDGRQDTRWAAAGSRGYPQWWLVDLGAETTVYGVRISWYASTHAYRYRVATSVDGLTFTSAVDRSKNRVRGVTVDDFSVVARYVRVVVLGVNPAGAVSAYEITVNGEPVAASEPTPEPTPSPTETPDTPKPTPGPTTTPTVTPTPTPEPTSTPTAEPTPEPTPTPTLEPTPDPTETVTPTPTPTPTPTVTPTVIPTPTPTPTPTSAPTPATGTFNVMDYGAKGDGRTDDVANIQSAISAAHGAPVYFPAGTYRLASTLTVPNGTNLVGAGMTNAWLQGQVVFSSASSFTDLKIGPAVAGLAGLRNADGARSTVFTRCHFRGGGAASDEYNSPTCCLGGGRALSNAVFTDCEFERSLGDNWTGPGDNTHIDNVIRIDARSGKRIDTVTFDGCHFGVSNGVATGSKRMGIEVWSGHGATDQFRNMTFRSCVFEATNNCQLDFSCYGDSLQAENILVEGCTFKGGGVGMTSAGWGYAICLEWPKNVVIKNNTFYRCSETAINTNNYTQPYDGNWKITGNTFDFDTAYEGITARMGIIVMQGANSVITGNTFTWHGSFSGWPSNGCILFAHGDATGNTVTGNTFNVSQTQRIGNNWGGAAGNGSPWTSTNTVNRQ